MPSLIGTAGLDQQHARLPQQSILLSADQRRPLAPIQTDHGEGAVGVLAPGFHARQQSCELRIPRETDLIVVHKPLDLRVGNRGPSIRTATAGEESRKTEDQCAAHVTS